MTSEWLTSWRLLKMVLFFTHTIYPDGHKLKFLVILTKNVTYLLTLKFVVLGIFDWFWNCWLLQPWFLIADLDSDLFWMQDWLTYCKLLQLLFFDNVSPVKCLSLAMFYMYIAAASRVTWWFHYKHLLSVLQDNTIMYSCVVILWHVLVWSHVRVKGSTWGTLSDTLKYQPYVLPILLKTTTKREKWSEGRSHWWQHTNYLNFWSIDNKLL